MNRRNFIALGGAALTTSGVKVSAQSNDSARKRAAVAAVRTVKRDRPNILDEIATESGKTFAIVIDEAHSSQGGKTSAAMSQALTSKGDDSRTDPEDTINEALEKRMAARKMAEALRRIQRKEIDYQLFLRDIESAGVANYCVYLAGKRAIYTGRTAVAYGDYLLGKQMPNGFWETGYDPVYMADTGSTLGLYIVLYKHVDRERQKKYFDAIQHYVDSMSRNWRKESMNFITSTLALGIAFAIVAGIMSGVFTLPMKYLGRWSWENVWALFIVVSCVIMPIAIAWSTIPEFAHVLGASPLHAVVMACVSGFAWGFGAIMFGQGISAIGISMGNTLVLAISASLGSFLPILVLAPERLHQSQGKAIILGTLIGIAGIVCCGYAGFLRERSQKDKAESTRGEMVGHARPFYVGLLLCIGSGLLSAIFNTAYSSAQPVLQTAVRMGHSAYAGSNLIWLLMLTSGAVPNLFFCGYLFKKNGSWGKYALARSAPLYFLAAVMGLLWGGNIFVYGFASPDLGKLGPAIGWPLTLITGLITANLCGFLTGEWKLTGRKDRQWMTMGLAVLLVAVATLGWSSTLGR